MSPWRRLLAYAVRYRRDFVWGLVYVVITRAITLAAPTVLGHAVDDLLQGVTVLKLAGYGGLLLAIGVVGGVFLFLMRRVIIGASRRLEYDIRNDFFAHLEKMPLSYFQSHRTGDLMSRATNDLSAVRMMLGPAILYSTSTVLTFIVALARMITIDPWLTIIALVPLPFVTISVRYFGKAIHDRFEDIQAQLSDISAVVQESLSAVRVVRAYRQESTELERFRRSNQEFLDRNRRLIVLQGFFFPSMTFFLGLGALLVLWIGSREAISGRITLGQFVAFSAYMTMLSWPMIAFGWVTNMLQRGMASWKRMLEVMDATPAVTDPVTSDQGAASAIGGEIEFRDLTFSYGERPVLRHVSARIGAGQTVALVGPTGSGKSTLINLLARLHEPPRGTVFVDGVDVRDLPLSILRGAIGFVPQEPFLFSDTLANNVAFGFDAERLWPERGAGVPNAAAALGWPAGGKRAPGATPSESDRGWGPASSDDDEERRRVILDSSAVARLDKDVADFPMGIDTMIGERGITLSGGQKQRTAIARAVALDPRILILDDALSAVDTFTEEEILSRLRDVMSRRTSMIVSHRISTVREADQIFVLDDGRIAERGTHAELIRASGLYASLHKKQLLEEELAAS